MGGPFDSKLEIASMLARQFLGFEDYSKDARILPAEISSAQAQVEINLSSMVRGIRRQIWIDTAAIADRVEKQLEAACADVNIDRVIAEAVAAEIANMKRTIGDVVRKRIHDMIENAILDKIQDGPYRYASKVVARMWDALVPEVPKRRGDSYKVSQARTARQGKKR